MSKRLLAFLLSGVLAVSNITPVMADEVLVVEDNNEEVASEDIEADNSLSVDDEEVVTGNSETDLLYVVNPEYADVFSVEDVKEYIAKAQEDAQEASDEEQLLSASEQKCNSLEEAAIVLRSEIVKRNPQITIMISDVVSLDSSDIWDEAVKHTGKGYEGDYINKVWSGYSVRRSNSEDYYSYTYTASYYTNAEQEVLVTAKLDEVYKDLELDKQLTNYKKILKIYKYITDNVTYDYTNLNNSSYLLKYTAYAALINKTSVCQGYACLFYRMTLDNEIDSRYISGIGNGGSHGWNIVKLNGKYYNLDSTWDAGRSSYSYFLLNDSDFDDHTRDESLYNQEFLSKYPISENSYSYDVINIIQQPKNAEYKAGTSHVVTVEAESADGSSLLYQWYAMFLDDPNVWYRITSQTTASFEVYLSDGLNPRYKGATVKCLISNDDGISRYSDTAILGYVDNTIYDENTGLYYIVNSDNTVTLKGIKSGTSELTLPSAIDGKTVTGLNTSGFSNGSDVTKVTNNTGISISLTNINDEYTWRDFYTGEEITSAPANGIAVRSDIYENIAPKVLDYSLDCEYDMSVDLFVRIPDEAEYFERVFTDGSTYKVPKNEIENNDSYEGYRCDIWGICPKDMDKPFAIRIYDANDRMINFVNQKYVVGGVFTTCYYELLMNAHNHALSENNIKLDNLAYSMKNYGDAARSYLRTDSDTTNPYDFGEAPTEITEAEMEAIDEYAPIISGALPEGISYVGTSLVLEDTLRMRFYFRVAEGHSIDEYNITKKRYGYSGNPSEVAVTKVEGADGLYKFDFYDLSLSFFDRFKEIEVKKVGDDGNGWKIIYSPLSYVYKAVNLNGGSAKLKNLALAMYRYYAAAEDYKFSYGPM